MVVLDHHQVGMELPPAVAIVNPSRPDDVSGQGNLAAVGVTFMTAVALLRELRRRNYAGSLAATSCRCSNWWRSGRSATWFR